MWSFNTQWGSDILMWIYEKLRTVSLHCYLSFIHCSLYTFILFKPTMPWSGDSCCWLTQNPKDPGQSRRNRKRSRNMNWYGFEKTYWWVIECLSPRGLPLSRWFIAEGLTNCAGRDGSPSQMMVLLMASSHTSASVGVLCWLLSLVGGREREREKERQRERETGSESKGQRGWGGFGSILAHRERPQCLSKSNMQTPAFREINTLPQTAQSASGGKHLLIWKWC